MLVDELGYELIGNSDNSDTALIEIQNLSPDLLLVDININGTMDGIELMVELQKFVNIPIIFVTSYDDKETFAKTKKLKPFAYIVKPFDSSELERSIELAFSKFVSEVDSPMGNDTKDDKSFFFEDAIFVKSGNKIEKILLDDISYCEVDNNYSTLHTVTSKKYVVRMNLDLLNKKMPKNNFLRVNRKYSINLAKATTINLIENTVMVDEKAIPIGRTFKEELISKLNLFK